MSCLAFFFSFAAFAAFENGMVRAERTKISLTLGDKVEADYREVVRTLKPARPEFELHHELCDLEQVTSPL